MHFANTFFCGSLVSAVWEKPYHSSQNYHDFFYMPNESPNSHMHFEKKNQAKQYRTTQVMPPSIFLFFTFSAMGKTLSFHHKKIGLNYPDFNENPDLCMHFAKKISPNSLSYDISSVGKAISLITQLVWIALFFFTVFYISNESPDSCVHFAKKISPNSAELLKLCLH